LFAKKLNVLGHIIENNKISMDQIKIAALLDRKPPTNLRETRVT
jgi:hypothetical protein